MSLNPLSWIGLATRLERLWALERKHGAILETHAFELQALKDRMTRLEEYLRARGDILIVEARSAAGTAASGVASQHVSDISARLGRLEERIGSESRGAQGSRRRLPDDS